MSKCKNKAINKRLVSCQHVVSSSLLVCLCSSQGHGLWPINRLQRLSELYMERTGVCVCVWERGGGYTLRADMSVSPRPAGVWPLLPRRPLTPVETVQVAAESLWKHLSPAWVIGHMGDSAILVTPAVPGMFWEALMESMATFPNSPHILVILFWDPHAGLWHNYIPTDTDG